MNLTDSHKVYGLFGANISLAGVQTALEKITPLLSALLIIVQIAVAVATLVYTVRQIIRKKKAKTNENPPS